MSSTISSILESGGRSSSSPLAAPRSLFNRFVIFLVLVSPVCFADVLRVGTDPLAASVFLRTGALFVPPLLRGGLLLSTSLSVASADVLSVKSPSSSDSELEDE